MSSSYAASTSSRRPPTSPIAVGSMNRPTENWPAYEMAVMLKAVPASGPKA